MVMGRRRRVAWLFPLGLVALFIVLVTAGLNGSSLALLAVKPPVTVLSTVTHDQDPDLLVGSPRPIRSDEWAIGTTLSVGQTADGFDPQPWVGLTPTDLSVVSYSAPQRALVMLLKPETWGYFVLGPDRGLAWAWWFPWVAAGIALYALLLLLTGRPGLSMGMASLGVITPYAAWWTSPSPNLFIAFALSALTLFLLAVRARSVPGRIGLSVSAGYFATALALTLYPPWVLSVAMVVAALFLGLLIDSRTPLRTLVVPFCLTGGFIAVVGGWWFVGASEDLQVIANTIYPGQRVSGPGEARLDGLLSAYANPYTALTDAQPALSNQSEISAMWLALPLIALLLPLLISTPAVKRQGRQSGWRMGYWTVGALTAVFAVQLGWALFRAFPEPLARVLLLTRLPGNRVPLALGLALLLLVTALNQLGLGSVRPRWPWVAGLFGALLSGLAAVWSAQRLYPGIDAKWLVVVLLGAVVVAGALLSVALDRGIRIALPVAVVYVALSVSLVNPLYRGLGPLREDPVSLYALDAARQDPGSRAIALGGRELNALVRGGGMQVLSGTTFYPNEQFWQAVLPQDPGLWNNYRNYEWSYDSRADPITGTVTAPDAALLQVNLCDRRILDLRYESVFTVEPIEAPCLTLDKILDRPNGERVRVYTPEDPP